MPVDGISATNPSRATKATCIGESSSRLGGPKSSDHTVSSYNGQRRNFDQHLTFRSHIERVRQKAWAAYHQIRNMTSRFWGVSTLVMVRLYRSFVCPILEYACQVWSTAPSRFLRTLEVIQRSCLRTASGSTVDVANRRCSKYGT